MEPLEGRQLLAAELISVNLAGSGPGNGDSFESSVSGNGRYVVFTSNSTDLVSGDTNNATDIFLRDRHNNQTILVSKNPTSGAVGDDASFEAKINNDGTFVVFASRASNLVTGDTAISAGGNPDVFRYNISNGAIELVSIRTNGGFPGGASGEPTVSSDGRFVAFRSFAGNLGTSDVNDVNDIFVRDMTLGGVGAIKLVSATPGGPAGDKESIDPQISDDGNFVSFRSDATNLVTNDANNLRDTFVRNIAAGTTALVSVSPTTGQSGDQPSESNSISGDGNFVAFRSFATNLAPNDTNNADDIFLRNLQTGTTTLLSNNRFNTASARGSSRFPWLSADATATTFSSTANDLIDGDNNNLEDIFLRDLENGPIYLISTNAAGNAGGNGASFDTYVTRDGKFISFTSEASDLATVTDSNAKQDVFIQVAPNNPGDPGDPDPDPSPGPGPSPNPNPNPNPPPDPNPDPNPDQPDTTPPLVSLPGSQPAPTQGSTEYSFNVNLADERGLNTLVLGNLTVTKQGGSPQTATFVNVVGSGKTAQATYKITFSNPLSSADNGTYTVDLPADAIKDAAGNSAVAATLGTFVLNVGNPNDPDLTAEVTSKFKTGVLIISSKAKGTAKVKVANIGQTEIAKQNVAVTVFLSDNQSRDAADTQLATQTKSLSLKTGKSKNLSFKFNFPLTAGSGQYFLVAQVDDGNAIREANEGNNVGVTTNSVNLQQPFTDLRATVNRPTGTPGANAPGSTTVTVINDGNVKLSRNVTIRLGASLDNSVDPSDAQITTITKKVSVSPGKPKGVPIKFNFPSSLPAGTYFLTATIDPLGEIIETSKSNNNAAAAETFAIS